MSSEILDSIWVPSPEEIAQQETWIREQIKEIGEETIQELIDMAVGARESAYKPYSGYAVGASILCVSGNKYAGANGEVVTYSETDHAEGRAIGQARDAKEHKTSGRRFIRAIVVSHDGESGPCGACRQRIIEHCDDALVIDVDGEGNIQKTTSMKILFPYAFTPTHLGRE